MDTKKKQANAPQRRQENSIEGSNKYGNRNSKKIGCEGQEVIDSMKKARKDSKKIKERLRES